jgi:hypothetical protein
MDVNDHLNGAAREPDDSSTLDPIAGMRAIADIQAEGLRAAGELLDRVLGRDGPSSPPSNADSSDREYMPLLDAWASLLERFASGLSRAGAAGDVVVALDSDRVGPAVLIGWAEGLSTEVEVRLHNPGEATAGPLRLRAGSLVSPEGSELRGAEVRVEPDGIGELAAGASCTFTVSLRAECTPPAGVYRGALQATGAPSLWLPIEVRVEQC